MTLTFTKINMAIFEKEQSTVSLQLSTEVHEPNCNTLNNTNGVRNPEEQNFHFQIEILALYPSQENYDLTPKAF